MMKQTFKPNFVSDREGRRAIIHLGRQLPAGSSDLPGNDVPEGPADGPSALIVSLFGLAPREVCPAAPVTKRAGGLLPHRFTHHPL